MFTLPVRTTASSAAPAPARPVPAFVAALHEHGDAPAVVGEARLTYRELSARVDSVAERLSSARRRLVQVEVGSDLDSLVAYLGAVASGHVVLVTAGDDDRASERLLDVYSPDVVLRPDGNGFVDVDARSTDGIHDLHDDLTLLLSTSGSTGSPKLVRLSRENVDSNAAQIADYLEIRSTDRAALTLPLHYCYGLSIVHSNLLAGAALFIDDRSVVDRCFWQEFRRWGATSISGVPYTFELLDRVGFEALDLPTLRYVTQAGGRMAPSTVERYARLGERRGWDLFVMYGQTEATARIAYLPPRLAASRPAAIGIPVPGGDLRIDAGELVYRGPNVMLGYATSPADLGRGRDVHELRTGDLAIEADDGLYEIVGRAARFIKPYGLRVDLDRVEAGLAAGGLTAACTGDDRRLVVAVCKDAGTLHDAVIQQVQGLVPLPRTAIDVVPVSSIPRLGNGKVDYAALHAAAPEARGDRAASAAADGDHVRFVRALFRRVLGSHEVADTDTFVDLGGDSLSYVEMSIALEERLGELPLGWPTLTVAELAALAPPATHDLVARRWRKVEMNVLLRAVAIVVIVGSHTAFMNVRGGAHVLLAVAGFNTARFHLSRAASSAQEVLSGIGAAAARVALPAAAWIGAWVAFADRYSLANVVFVNSLVGPTRWGERWQYWFIEVLLHILVGVSAFVCVPPLRRAIAKHGFAVATALTVVALLLRYDAAGIASAERLIHRADTVVWFFTLGWAAHLATSAKHRLLLTALLAAGIPHYFESGRRESYVTIGVLALIWVARVRLPAGVLPVVRVLAASSLYVYLTHWQLYPAVADATGPLVALVASLAAGAAVWWGVERVTTAMQRSKALVRS